MFASISQAATGGRSAPVKVVEAQNIRMAPQTWVAGTVISRYQARLATEVDGKLVKVVEVGTQVKEDQVVARIDPTFITLKIEEYQAGVERDRARLDFLKGEVQRLKRLAQQSNASQTLLDQTRAEREVARNELRIARTRLKQAREEKRRHVMRAPFDGVVVERLMRRGERAAVGDEVIRLIDSQALEVQARVPLSARDFVREGNSLLLRFNDSNHQGRVRALVTVGDERSRLLDLRVALPDNGYTVGQPLRVSLPTAQAREVVAVPRDALVLRRDGASVYRINAENKAERVVVQVGSASGDLVEVIGGLQAGDRVVTRGGERLRPGAAVSIIGEQPNTTAKQTPPNGK